MPISELDQEPSLGRIRDLHDHVTGGAWTKQTTLDTRLLDLYFSQHTIETPNTDDRDRQRRIKPERLATGEAARIIDLGVSFYVNPPRLGTQFSGEGSFSETKSENVGKGINEAIDQLNPALQGPWAEGTWQQLVFGRTADLILPGHQYWWDFPYKEPGETEEAWRKRYESWRKKAPLPLCWLTLPADSTFPASLASIDDEAISTKEMSWLDLMDVFSKKELAGAVPEGGDDKQKLRENVTLAIYSNRQWLAYAVMGAKDAVTSASNDHLLRVVEHELGTCAIRIVPGITTGRKEPGYYWRSVLYPVMDEIEMADKIMTLLHTSAKFDALPMLQEFVNNQHTDEEGEGAKGEIKQVGEGDVLTYFSGDGTIPPEGGMKAVFQPTHGTQMQTLLALLLERIARKTGMVEILEGQTQANQPAWSQNASAEMAKGKLRPLTSAVIARGIHVGEMISKAVIAFGEDIPLAKFDDKGNRTGSIMLSIDELKQYEPVLSGTYEPKLPINWRADLDVGAKLMQMALADPPQVIMSPVWILEKFAGEDDFYSKHYRELMEVKFMMSQKVRLFQEKHVADQFEANLSELDLMTLDQFNVAASGLPGPTAEFLRQYVGQPNGGRAPAVSAATAGAVRAGGPGSALPGGPQPQNAPVVP